MSTRRNLLAILATNPFPASDGTTYPIAGQLEGLSRWWKIDILEVRLPNARQGFDTKTHYEIARDVLAISAPDSGGKLWNISGELLGGRPYFIQPASPPNEIAKVIGNRSYDAIYVSPLGLANWATAVAQCQPIRPKLILNQNDSITERFRRDYDLFKLRVLSWRNSAKHFLQSLRARYMAAFEKQIHSHFDLILVQTKRDRDVIIADTGVDVADKLLVAPNGIKESLLDLEYRQANDQRLLHLGGLSRNRRDLVFWFLRDVFLPVRQQLPRVTIQLAGSMSAADRKLLEQMPGVHPLGFVDDVRDVLATATMSIAPLFMRSGLVNKVIDSMAAGVPASGTKAFNGLPGFENGKHGFDVVDAPSWRDLLAQTLSDPELLSRVSLSGRQLVSQHLRWQKTVDSLHHRLCQLVDCPTPSAHFMTTGDKSRVALLTGKTHDIAGSRS